MRKRMFSEVVTFQSGYTQNIVPANIVRSDFMTWALLCYSSSRNTGLGTLVFSSITTMLTDIYLCPWLSVSRPGLGWGSSDELKNDRKAKA